MKNLLKEVRQSKKITQQVLASMVGTSQQQIQRIEAGKLEARLDLAMQICKALNVSLDEVFPGANAAVKEFLASKTRTASPLTAVGLGGIYSRMLKVWMRGHEECFVWPISSAVYEALSDEMFNEREQSRLPEVHFTVFDSEKERVALNLSQVDAYQFIDEFGGGLVTASASDSSDLARLCFIGSHSVHRFNFEIDVTLPEGSEDMGNCAGFMHDLASLPEPTTRFFIQDADGDFLNVRAGNLALATIPHWMFGLEIEESDEDI